MTGGGVSGSAAPRPGRTAASSATNALLVAIQVTVVPLATAQPVPQWQLSKLPLVSIGARDGTGPDVFGWVAGVQELGNGSIAIADGKAKEVRFFSATGGHLVTIGRDGAGPGEFRYILSLRVCAGDSLLVHDLALRRLSVLNPEGRYARAMDLRDWIRRPSNDFACNRTGAFAMLSRDLSDPGAVGPHRSRTALTVIDGDGSSREVATVAGSERYFFGSVDGPRPLGKQTAVALGSEVVYVGTADSFFVDRFTLKGDRLGPVRLARRATPITKAIVRAFVAEEMQQRNRRRPGRDRRETERRYLDLDYPATLPAYRRLFVDDGDRLWVEVYPIPGATQREWAVFSPDGNVLATLRHSSSFELLSVRGSHVSGIWRDEMDAEYVQVYAIRR